MLCQSCGRPLPLGAQFCGECGAQVGAPSATFDAPESPTVPEGVPVQGAVLPPSPPLADAYGSVPPPPPPVVGPPPEFVAGAPTGGNGRRTALILAAIATVVVVVLVGLGFALARSGGDGEDEASPVTTVATAPEVTTAPPVTEAPTTEPSPSTTAAPTTPGGGEPSDADATIEAFCDSAEELGALLQDAIDDPFNADPQQITELSAQLSEQAASLTADATPEELERISECTAALNVTP